MQTLTFFFALFVTISFVSGQRAIRSGSVGTGNGKACYIVSAQYQTRPAGASGNVFAAAMGINLPIQGITLPFPWTALAYVKGSVDLDGYQSTALDQVHLDASGGIAAWSYVAIGEFCDVNGQEGYQQGSSDYIIKYYTAPQALLYNNDCGLENDPITGDPSYYSTVKTALADIFQVTCRVFKQDTSTPRLGRTVGPYTYKCDIRIDYSLLWATNTTEINGCSDDNRKIGILINVASAAFDVDVTANLNTASADSPDGDKVSFNAGKLVFAWDNFYKRVSNFNGTTGSNGVVTAAYFQAVTDTTNNQVYGAASIRQFIFSFDAPKSSGNQFYFWDPSTTLMDTDSSSSLFPAISMMLMCFVALFF